MGKTRGNSSHNYISVELSRVSFARSLESKRSIYATQIYQIIIYNFSWLDCLCAGGFFFRMGNNFSIDSFKNTCTKLIDWLKEIIGKTKDAIFKCTLAVFRSMRDAVLYAFETLGTRKKRAEAAYTVSLQVLNQAT